MQFFSEIIFLNHNIGQALMRNIKQIDEGLHITGIQQISADIF